MSAAIFATGCDMHRMTKDPAPSRVAQPQYSIPTTTPSLPLAKAWYESFQHPGLNALEQAALQDNLDIAQAVARLAQANALARAARGASRPQVDGVIEGGQSWNDGNSDGGGVQGGIAASWDLDIFNRLSNTASARQLEAAAAAADIAAMRLAISAELAESWFKAAAQQAQLALLQRQSDTGTRSLELIDMRFQAGLGTRVDVLQQQSQLAGTQSLIPPTEANLRVAENRLDVLTGAAPDAVNRVPGDTALPDLAALPPLGVPSDLLQARPDLLALQNRLVASDAQIGAAIADRLPRVTLSGALLAGGGSMADQASILGGLVQPLLDWGQRKAEVTRNKALYQERLAAYTQAYLRAVEQVENALYQENRQRAYVQRLAVQRATLAETLAAAEAVYKAGDSDYLAVLTAMDGLHDVERTLINQRLNLVLARIAVYRALGGPLG
ncbi:MAG: efflux transporter outer membrane subunit [Pseudomonadota bacterium]